MILNLTNVAFKIVKMVTITVPLVFLYPSVAFESF